MSVAPVEPLTAPLPPDFDPDEWVDDDEDTQ